ncbi:phage tail protein [Ensifer sp. ZNC0028]|uniref:phage tail protein n=1 Tax=Ensifer sp. ZNC0028 TaxID=1339236 RepID=UPI0005BBF05E|nr:tail fiber protein [Ensifer sp. ZNC0028]
MTEVFIGQIMMGGFNFAPRGFALCNGQIMPIAQYQALFSLLMTKYGGNGTNNFALPDLRGRTPVAFGPSADAGWQPTTPYGIGNHDGEEAVALTSAEIPPHTHQGKGTTAPGKLRVPANMLYATTTLPIYAPTGETQVQLSQPSVAPAGDGQAHSNMQPYSAINFSIALTGIYPSRN